MLEKCKRLKYNAAKANRISRVLQKPKAKVESLNRHIDCYVSSDTSVTSHGMPARNPGIVNILQTHTKKR